MPIFTGSLSKYPARVSLAWYVSVIAIGGTLLWQLPQCRQEGVPPISPVDAYFTATSATCVTGLSVRSTGNDFSFLGQLIILAMIQLGGIGIITITTLITFQIGARTGLRERALVAETLGAASERDLAWLLRHVVLWSLTMEFIGFLLLAWRNFENPNFEMFAALWHALFHSVSAFCNAGFGLFDDNLVPYQTDMLVNFTIAGLIIVGGIGYPVIFDLYRNLHSPWTLVWERLHLHTKVMLLGTAGLIVLGMLAILMLEWNGTLAGHSLDNKCLISFFQSVTCRTAGFNTVPIDALTSATLFIMILLMAIGAGPCSTAGGFKVSTFMTLVLRGWTTFRGYERINVFRRTIPQELVSRATATALLFGVVAILGLMMLLASEHANVPHKDSGGSFIASLFEVISALGTVGLSTGITAALNDFSKCILIGLMFLGRLGPITVFLALSLNERDQRVGYPHEEPLIG